MAVRRSYGFRPPDHANSHVEKKLQVSMEKHYTKKPDRNRTFSQERGRSEGAILKSSERTASRERDPSCGAAIAPLPNQLWEDMLWQRSQFIRQSTAA